MVSSFTGEYRFLSNFYPAPINYVGLDFPASEHAYVAAKTDDLEIRKHISESGMTSGQIKRYGRTIELRPDWNSIKLKVMTEIVFAKFEQNPALLELLRATGDSILIEGNNWGDTFWGVCKGVGHNHLGKILMQVRDNPFASY